MVGIQYRPLSDMESNGVYFETDEDVTCHYSGLPALSVYMEEVNEDTEENDD